MGRPLKKETIEKMNLVARTQKGQVVLGKQVGYNKYIVDEETRQIVRLANELVQEDDAVLSLTVGESEEPVTKILKNIFQTDKGVYAYKLVEEEVVFEREDVSFAGAVVEEPAKTSRRKSKKEEVVEETPVVEEPTPVEEPVVEEPTEVVEEVVEEPTEVVEE